MKYATLALLCLLALASGYYCGTSSETNTTEAPSEAATPMGSGNSAGQSSQQVQDQPMAASAKAAHVNPPIPTLTRLQVLASLGRQKNQVGFNYQCPLVTPGSGDTLDQEFIHVFGLNPTEVATIQQVLSEAKTSMRALQIAARKVEYVAETGTLTVEIPALPTQGGAIYDRVNSTVRTVLGGEREAYFNQIGAQSLEVEFDRFGLRAKTITLYPSKTPAGKSYTAIKIQSGYAQTTGPLEGFGEHQLANIQDLIAKYYAK